MITSNLAVNKRGNSYLTLAGLDLYDACPKAVWAAIAIAALCRDDLGEARERLLAEWQVLHQNGIVPQGLPRPLAAEANRLAWRKAGTE